MPTIPRVCHGLTPTDRVTPRGKPVFLGQTCPVCESADRYLNGLCIGCCSRRSVIQKARQKEKSDVTRERGGRPPREADIETPVPARTWLWDFVHLSDEEALRLAVAVGPERLPSLVQDYATCKWAWETYESVGKYWHYRRIAEGWLRFLYPMGKERS